MKEHPILFSAQMVLAIMEGRKTQTRRVVKKQPNIDPQTGDFLFTYSDGTQEVSPIEHWIKIQKKLHCPYGKPGDSLWVRETWAKQLDGNFIYRADYPEWQLADNTATGHWKPSIFMPRSASRILLEITDIRIERLNDISETDSIAEGVESWIETRWKSQPTHYKIYYRGPGDESTHSSLAKFSYETLWQSINGPKSWDENPFVWVITFKNISHANP